MNFFSIIIFILIGFFLFLGIFALFMQFVAGIWAKEIAKEMEIAFAKYLKRDF